MAVNKSKAQVETASAVASFNPDQMSQGGLPDDFDGTIAKARITAWDYDGNIKDHILALALTIEREDGEESFVQHYSMGDINAFVPSRDGKTSCNLDSDNPEDWEGYFAMKAGKRDALSNNSNFAHFIGALIDAGFDKANLSNDIRFLEGIRGHFNQIPQKKRSGIQVKREEGEDNKREKTLLVITELKEGEAPKSAAKGGTASKPAANKPAAGKPAPKEDAEEAAPVSDLDTKLQELVTEAVLGADEGLPKSKLASIVIKGLSGAEKAKGLKRVGELDFLNGSETWTYDADTATLFSNA